MVAVAPKVNFSMRITAIAIHPPAFRGYKNYQGPSFLSTTLLCSLAIAPTVEWGKKASIPSTTLFKNKMGKKLLCLFSHSTWIFLQNGTYQSWVVNPNAIDICHTYDVTWCHSYTLHVCHRFQCLAKRLATQDWYWYKMHGALEFLA